MDTPIACSLPPDALRERRAHIDRIARQALRSRRHIAGGARLTFAAGPEIADSLRELIAAEADCCAFLQMNLHAAGSELVLDVTGPEEAQPIIAEIFA
jgi:hypothetical protein